MNNGITYYKDVEQFFQSSNIAYKPESGGEELRILCPFCQHQNQKCYVQKTTGLFYCFHCGQGGTWRGLIRRFGISGAVIQEKTFIDEEKEPELPPIDPAIVDRNHKRLLDDSCKPIREYLYNRGLNDATIEKFKLGWDTRNIVIPIFDANGDCVNFKLKPDPTLPSRSKGMFSIRGRGRKRLFNEQVLKQNPEMVIICEGEWDAMLLDQNGYNAVTSTAGAQSFDARWIDAFKGIKKISLTFDNDRNGAGQAGAKKTAEMFSDAGISVFIISLPNPSKTEEKIDITDFFVKYDGAKKFPELLNDTNTTSYVSKNTDDEENPKEKKPLEEKLVELTLDSGCEVYLDSEKDPVIIFPEKPLVAYPIRSKEYRMWLSGMYYAISGKGFSNDIFSLVANILEGKAYHENSSITLYNRIAKVENEIYVDLGNDKTVIHINDKDWTETTNCPVKFKRFKHQLPQVVPVKGGNLADILKYINIFEKKEQLLFLTYLITVFIPDIPRAILVHIGDQGAAKSTAMRVARSLIDPSHAELLIPPSDVPELALAANHNYCLYLDNLSSLSEQLSDVLCRLVTGVGFTKRKLYTDAEDIIFRQIVAVGITGINNVATKPDLLDRTLILRFQRIPDDKREDEEDFWKRFNSEKPYILGAIFTAISKALQIVPNLKLTQKPRMADYGKYAAAAAIAIGNTAEMFLTAFAENVQRQNNAAIEASAVAQVIIDFMKDKDVWEGSSSELHELLKTLALNANLEMGGKHGFPKASNWLWKKIHVIRPNLIALGINASHTESNSGSLINLTRIKQTTDTNTADAATQPETQTSNDNDAATEDNSTATDATTNESSTNEPKTNDSSADNGNMATMAADNQNNGV